MFIMIVSEASMSPWGSDFDWCNYHTVSCRCTISPFSDSCASLTVRKFGAKPEKRQSLACETACSG